MKPTIQFPDFEKLDIRIGLIKEVKDHPNADKLYVLTVDFGSEVGERTIVSGLKDSYTLEELKNKQATFIINLEPRELRGIKSEGMILASEEDKAQNKYAILLPEKPVTSGNKVS